MKKRVFYLILSLLLIFFFTLFYPKKTKADFADLIVPNNKLGIHLAVPAFEDMEKAAQLVNSNNGDWGYITLVMQENDLNKDKWQGVFDKARKLHLIPIVRLATSFANGHWHAPQIEEVQKWVDFLDSLNWVVKNRYVILFNEPNHADEWGGLLSPKNFAEVTLTYAKTLKESSPDYFIMMAGFDSAAPSDANQHEDEVVYLKKAIQSQPNLFNYLDGWSSHSYPKSKLNYGRNSIKNYQWELSLLQSLGIKKNLPIFITETGWCHQEGKTPDYSFLPEEKIAQLTVNYFKEILKDNRVVAITPFILNYQDEPFDHYSWQKLNSQEFYQQYTATQGLAKIKGEPLQITKISIPHELPKKLIRNSTYQIALTIRNDGQDIWDSNNGYNLQITGLPINTNYFFSDLEIIAPFEEKTIWLYLKTGDKVEETHLKISLVKNKQNIGNQIDWDLEIVPETTIKLIAKLLFKRKAVGDDFKFLIYNQNQEVIFSADNFQMENNEAEIKGLKNLIIDDQYRLVLLKPFYLPRQTFIKISENDNTATFKVLLPFDFNQNGNLSWSDIWTLIKNPKLFRLLIPN